MLSESAEKEVAEIEDRLALLSRYNGFSYQLVLRDRKSGYYRTSYRIWGLDVFRKSLRDAWHDVLEAWVSVELAPGGSLSNHDEDDEEEK